MHFEGDNHVVIIEVIALYIKCSNKVFLTYFVQGCCRLCEELLDVEILGV